MSILTCSRCLVSVLFTDVARLHETGAVICYACCDADTTKLAMLQRGAWRLYLETPTGAYFGRRRQSMAFPEDRAKLTNWPGTLSIDVERMERRKHRRCGSLTFGTFTGPDGAQWRFRRYGDNTQIAHCQRVRVSA